MLLYYFITFLALTVPFNLSLYMQNLHIGNAEKSGTLISIFFHKYTGKNKFFQNQAILHSLIRYSKGVINKTTTLKT